MTAPGLETPVTGLGLPETRSGDDYEAPTTRTRSRVGGLFGGALLGLTLALVAAAAFLVGLSIAYQGRILPGVQVAGVDLSGLDRAGAEARLAAALPPVGAGRLTLGMGGQPAQTISLATLGRRYDVAGAVDVALGYGHDGSPLARAEAEVRGLLGGVQVSSALVYDDAAVDTFMSRVAAATALAPVSAQVRWTSGTTTFTVVPSTVGRALDVAATTAALDAALTGTASRDISVEATVQALQPAVTDATAAHARQQADAFVAEPADAPRGGQDLDDQAGRAGGLDHVRQHDARHVRAAAGARQGLRLARECRHGRRRAGQGRGVRDQGVEGGRRHPLVPRQAARSRCDDDPHPGVAADGGRPAQRAGPGRPGRDRRWRPGSTPRPRRPTCRAWSSWASGPRPFVPSDHNFFGANIRIPASQINGYVLLPGQWFDFWKVVDVSSKLGFGPGGIIKDGHTDPTGALGGGICSCSTTLFNAALRSGLQMGARANHYYYIDRYPVGLDATVWKESSGAEQDDDLPQRHERAAPHHGGSSTTTSVTFQVYGVPDGRRVTLSTPIVKNYLGAIDTTVHTSALKKGQTYRAEYPVAGFDSWVTRTVYNAAGKIIHQETYYSHYARVNGILEIGTG